MPPQAMAGLGYLIHDAARLLRRAIETQARDHRLTLPQWRVIKQLSLTDGLSQTVLAGLIEANPMTLSDLIDRLEAHALVRRETDPGDSRAKLVWITPKGRTLVDHMRAVAGKVYDAALEGISEADRAALLRALGQITANLTGERQTEKGWSK